MDLEDLRTCDHDWEKMPLEIFRRRVRHEEQRHRERSYWDAKLEKKKAKDDYVEEVISQLNFENI